MNPHPHLPHLPHHPHHRIKDDQRLRVVFFGSGAFGLPTVRAVGAAHEIVGVVTQPDRPAGRGGANTPTPIGAWAAAEISSVPLLKPERVNEREVVERVLALGAEAFVVIAFGQKLGRALLGETFAINLHASLLPRWRGAAPINAAILAGDAETGVSVITLADRMDAGLILSQHRRSVEARLTAGELHDVLAEDGPALMLDVLRRFAEGDAIGRAQNESEVTPAPKLSKADGWVDFGSSAEHCRRRIHGLNPWPGVSAILDGARIKLLRAVVEEHSASGEPAGTIFESERGTVACGHGTTLRLIEVQPESKRPMSWGDFARGRKPGGTRRFETTILQPPLS